MRLLSLCEKSGPMLLVLSCVGLMESQQAVRQNTNSLPITVTSLTKVQCYHVIIAECLSARHIIGTLFLLSVYIYMCVCVSRLGM